MVAEALVNLLCLAVWGYIAFTFGRLFEAKARATRVVAEGALPSLVEDDSVEPEPITKRNPNTALAALAMRWDQEAWAEPEPIIGGAVLTSDEERSYHFLEVER